MKVISYIQKVLFATLLVCSASPCVNSAFAQGAKISDPIPFLDEEMQSMKYIDQFLMSAEKTRMKMFEVYTAQIMINLQNPKLGLGHEQTSEAFKDQISAIDSAEAYFSTIRNEFTADSIDSILANQNKLVEAYGFNRRAYAKNLYRILSQIELQLRALNKTAISDDLREKISKLYAPLGSAQAKAAVGDTRKAYDAAKPVSVLLTAMYEEFHHLSGSKEIFEAALMIEFLNERLISYGQYDLDT